MHIKKKFDPLPKDIQEFIDESEHGVVYFSLGGNLQPSTMPAEKQQAIINALSKIKERVVWKWDDSSVKVDKTKFLIKNWYPQDSVLAHPNVKVFITHGGLLGGSEAVYYAKPFITIPIFGDQKLNAARSVQMGFGVRVDYYNLTEASLTWALDEVLNSEKYQKNVNILSERFRNRPQHPLDLAKFYVEYVMHYKGASFMQSQANNLSFIEYHNLDVLVILSAILISIICLPILIIRKLINCCMLKSDSDNQIKLKKK